MMKLWMGRGKMPAVLLVVLILTVPFGVEVYALQPSPYTVLRAPDAQRIQFFGQAVAISNNTIVVGAPGPNTETFIDMGSVYVFERDVSAGNVWNNTAILHNVDEPILDEFGSSVAIDGDTIVVGAPTRDLLVGDAILQNAGTVYVFERSTGDPTQWEQVAQLLSANPQEYSWFGRSITIDGDNIVVGAYGEDYVDQEDAGRAYVFNRHTGGMNHWGLTETLQASPSYADDKFGHDVSIHEQTIVVGAPGGYNHAGLSRTGTAYVFMRNAGMVWEETAQLHASDGEFGDRFGGSVSVNGNKMAIGAPGATHLIYETRHSGASYVFQHQPDTSWIETAILQPDMVDYSPDYFGNLVKINGTQVVVGVSDYDGWSGDMVNAGTVYVYEQGSPSSLWYIWSLLHSDVESEDRLGRSVDLDDTFIVAGAPFEDGGDGNPLAWSGAVYVWENSSTPTDVTFSDFTQIKTPPWATLLIGGGVFLFLLIRQINRKLFLN